MQIKHLLTAALLLLLSALSYSAYAGDYYVFAQEPYSFKGPAPNCQSTFTKPNGTRVNLSGWIIHPDSNGITVTGNYSTGPQVIFTLFHRGGISRMDSRDGVCTSNTCWIGDKDFLDARPHCESF